MNHCKQCKYFVPTPSTHEKETPLEGFCHRHPPVISMAVAKFHDADYHDYGWWPRVSENDVSCGEGNPK